MGVDRATEERQIAALDALKKSFGFTSPRYKFGTYGINSGRQVTLFCN